MRSFCFILTVLFFTACKDPGAGETGQTASVEKDSLPLLNYSVTATFPHDTSNYTEGLFFHNGELYESTGSPDYIRHTRSVFGKVDRKTGKIDVKIELDRNTYFGEGTVILNNKIYQLTYKNKTGFIYDARTFKKTGEFGYANSEGWGLTTDGKDLIMSDGTNVITFLDSSSLKPVRTLTVNTFDVDAPDYLNELEYINGFIYANVWKTTFIVKIDPKNGNIAAMLDLAEVDDKANQAYENTELMNGIAYDPKSNKIYVTGKMWPLIFEIDFPH